MASSMASMPGMRRTNRLPPFVAKTMKPSTMPKKSSVIRNTEVRVELNHCGMGWPGPLDGDSADPPGPTARMRYQYDLPGSTDSSFLLVVPAATESTAANGPPAEV